MDTNNLGRKEQEAMEGDAYWLASPGMLSLVSCNTQDHQPRGDTAHTELDPLTSIIDRENVPQANLVGVFPQLKAPKRKWP